MAGKVKLRNLSICLTIASAIVVGAFGLFQGWFTVRLQGSKQSPQMSQKTSGDQSPAVMANGNVSISYGIPPKVIDRLTTLLHEKGLSEAEIQKRLKEDSASYRLLYKKLSTSSDPIQVESRRHLANGNFAEAEKLLSNSLEKSLENPDFGVASLVALELSYIKRLQSDVSHAKTFENLSVDLENKARNSGGLRSFNSDDKKSPHPFTSTVDIGYYKINVTILDYLSSNNHIVITKDTFRDECSAPCFTVTGDTQDLYSEIWVLFHLYTIDTWWVQPQAEIDKNGCWTGRVYLTYDLSPKDAFEIVVLSNPFEKIQEGMVLNNLPEGKIIAWLVAEIQ